MAAPRLAPAVVRPLARALVRTLAAVAVALPAATASAQMLDDAVLVPARQLRVSAAYGRERWSTYWEGTHARQNENIGTLVTQSTTLGAIYGLTDRVSLFATLPRVHTDASRGVLHGMHGWQDVTVAAKVRAIRAPVGERASLAVTALGGVGAPTSNYTPDFQPMSIGLGSRRATARGAVHLRDRSGLFFDGSMGYTWRSTVHLDRLAYYTDGALHLTNEVEMPDVRDLTAGLGFQNGWLCLPVSVASQRTLGGGDIRLQDMPFVSNRMDFTRVQAHAMITLPRALQLGRAGFIVDLGAMRVLSGRNVGRSTGFSGGLETAFRL